MKLPELNAKNLTVVVLFTFIFVYLDSTFLLKRQYLKANSSVKKINKLKRQLSALEEDIAKLKEAQAREGQKKQALEEKKIISEDQIPALLNEIQSLANKNGVKIMEMVPSKDLKSSPDRALGNLATVALALRLDLICEYHSCGSFINALENSANFMSVLDIKITPDSSDKLKQKVSLLLKSYVKK